ncbi:MAG: DUF421 domain-containing protein [Alicyclobacillaceae bacterium]|nr:DUF421 domain-containing protein [Alicyclobacillaceae bacterium]
MGFWIGRTVLVYFFVLVIMRLMGRREIGKLSVFDLVVSIMIAELSAIALEDPSGGRLWHAVGTIALLAGLQIIVSYLSLRSPVLRRWMDGSPVAVIEGGQVKDGAMRRLRYSFDDLMTQLRDKGVFRVDDVEWAVLEPSGKLSVQLKESRQPPAREDLGLVGRREGLPVIVVVDGEPYAPGLNSIGKDVAWLRRELASRGYFDCSKIFYAHVDRRGRWYVDEMDENTDGRSGP